MLHLAKIRIIILDATLLYTVKKRKDALFQYFLKFSGRVMLHYCLSHQLQICLQPKIGNALGYKEEQRQQ